MATANGADFATQCYRHGVLIGNWHEDQSGCDMLSASAAANASASASGLSSRYYPQTTTHSTFTTAGHDIIHSSVFDEKTRPRMSGEVDAGLLFPHKGAAPIDRRYQTSYLASYSLGASDVQPPVDRTVRKLAGEEVTAAHEESSRFRSYRTASSDAFNATNSVLALRADETATNIRRGAGLARSGILAQSLEANYRKLRLRRD